MAKNNNTSNSIGTAYVAPTGRMVIPNNGPITGPQFDSNQVNLSDPFGVAATIFGTRGTSGGGQTGGGTPVGTSGNGGIGTGVSPDGRPSTEDGIGRQGTSGTGGGGPSRGGTGGGGRGPSDPGSGPGGNPEGNPPTCELFNYHIGPMVEIVSTRNSLVGPDGVPLNLSRFPDHRSLTGTQCVLLAPVYECCWVRDTISLQNQYISNGATQVGWIILAYSKAVLSYRDCFDESGKVIGKRPVILQYFSADDIQLGGFGTVVGPSDPTKASSVKFKLGNGRITSDSGAPIWGNCYGTYGTDFFVNWFNQNQFSSFNFQNLQSPIFGEYLIDPSGNVLSGLGLVLETGECVIRGECKNNPEPPPPPSIECIPSTTVIPSNVRDWLNYAREHFGPISFIGASLQDSNRVVSRIGKTDGEEKQVSLLNDGAQISLESYGFPCQTGQVARFQRVSYATYPEFTFCFMSDGSTRLVFTGRTITDTSNPIYDGTIVDRPIGTRNFDPNCCERLANAYLTGNSTELSSLSSIGLRVQQIQRTKRFELVDSCGCEEIEIADLGCFFGNMNYSVILKADIKDQRTHTGVRRQVVDERCKGTDGPEVYHPFDRKRDIISNRTKSGTTGLFNGDDMMECYYTSSTRPTASNQYYYEVSDCETCGKIPYFAVTYGHISGSGSVFIQGENSNKTPTDSIYSQYQLICLEPTRSASSGISVPRFEFVSASSTVESNDVYVINFNRNGIKHKLDAGNFEINLGSLNGNSFANNTFTGSNVAIGSENILRLIDDSDDYYQLETCDNDPLASYNIISGSLEDGKYEDASVNTYGKVYPNIGVIVLHPKRLNEILNFNTVTGSNINGDNSYKLFTSISGAAAPYLTRSGSYYMTARNVKYKITNHYFVRAYAPMANYSNNPTFVSGSTNEIFDKCFAKNPQTYITSIGLYNSNRELVALAKLSRPVKKTFETDLLIKIRLNW